MWFNPTDVNPTHLAYTCIGGFVVIFSMFSNLAKEKLYIGEVIPATLFGIIVGPSGASIFTPRSWGNVSGKAANDITLEVTRVVLACGVFAIGAELPRGYMIRHWKSLVYTVVPVMAWGWFISAGLIVALFPELTYQSALVISACLTPTDPILAAAVVGGRYSEKNVPSHLRHLLAAESAANDGLAYPFLWLPLYLTLDKTTGEAVRDFICIAILYQVVLGVAIGMALGFIFSVLTKFLEKWKYVGRDSYVIQFLSLALFTIGAVTLMGNDDLLAAFAAGCTVSWDGHFHEQTEETIVFAHILELLLNCAVFVFVGGWIRFPSMNMPEFHITPGRLSAFFFLTLFVRRIPPMLLLYKTIPDIHTWKEALFAGWFGPMGIGAVFISTLALEHLPVPEGHPTTQAELISVVMHPIIAFTILGSIFIHGLSIPALSVAEWANRRTALRNDTTLVSPQQPDWLNFVQDRLPTSPNYSQDVTATNAESISPVISDPPKMLKASSDGNHLASRSPSPPATGAAQEAGPKSVAFATTSISRGGEPPFVIHQSERTLNRTSRSPSPLASQESSAQIIPARTQISSGNDRNLNTELDTAGMQKAE